MARFCANCGTKLPEDALFCGECGTKVEAPFAVETPTPSASSDAAPAESCGTQGPEETAFGAELEPSTGTTAETAAEMSGDETDLHPFMQDDPAVQPRKKPLPKWVLPAGIAAAAVIVLLVAVSLILKSVSAPEKTVDKFLAAMEAGDFEALSKVAGPADEDLPFTEASAAPMFALYKQNARFRKTLENCLEDDLDLIEDGDDPDEGNLVDLVAEKRFLHTGYAVSIESCSAEVSSELACTVQLTDEQSVSVQGGTGTYTDSDWCVYGSDYQALITDWSSTTVYDILPGLYELSATVTTTFGDVFEGAGTLEVADTTGAYGEVIFDYTTLDVYNDSSVEVDLSIGGSVYCTVPAYTDCYIAPIKPDTQVEATANIDTDAPMTQTFLAGDNDGYTYLSFVLCEVELYNGYEIPFYVYQDGTFLQKVDAGETGTLAGLPSGTELEIKLYEQDVMKPYTYLCESEYDYLYPDFELTDEHAAAADKAVTAYISSALEAFNNQDTAALGALTPTEFSEMLAAELEYNQGYTLGGDGFTYSIKAYLNEPLERSYVEVGSAVESAPTVSIYYDIPYDYEEQYTYAGGEVENDSSDSSMYYAFTVQYADGAWKVIATV